MCPARVWEICVFHTRAMVGIHGPCDPGHPPVLSVPAWLSLPHQLAPSEGAMKRKRTDPQHRNVQVSLGSRSWAPCRPSIFSKMDSGPKQKRSQVQMSGQDLPAISFLHTVQGWRESSGTLQDWSDPLSIHFQADMKVLCLNLQD